MRIKQIVVFLLEHEDQKGVRAYRTFDEDFKVNAVKLCLEETRSINKIAEELGINLNTLSNWKRDFEKI